MVMGAQQGQEKATDGVCTEVWRDIADAQAAIGSAVIAMGQNELLQRLGVLLVPATQFLGDGGRIEIGMVVQS